MKPDRFIKHLLIIFCLSGLLIACSDDLEPIKVSFVTLAVPQSTDITFSARAKLNHGKVQESGFLMSEVPGMTMDNTEKIIVGTGTSTKFFIVKFNLQPNTAYYFRPYIVVSGKTFLGDEEMVTTLEDDSE